ncbi:UNVERIFIED_CONTAM: hypothetical protein Sradi_6131300 [Sesamum radiatum]|uniref:Retrotransposon Copia-like N-terminal domain-containing protein n=1 Tax=Sesamum radiatum TaxID=300843 RepID=A0AAW2KJE2_SESRA
MASTSSMELETSATRGGSRNEIVNSRIQVVDHPSMVMISTPLNGNNWLSWSRSMQVTLEQRDKLGFIDGMRAKPTEGSVELRQWRITDSMVRTWT